MRGMDIYSAARQIGIKVIGINKQIIKLEFVGLFGEWFARGKDAYRIETAFHWTNGSANPQFVRA